MSIVYEVNLDVDAAIAVEFREWLQAHVHGILALPGFTGAHIFEVLDPAPADTRIAWCVQYTLADRAALDAYLRDHAARMRADGVARFSDGFNATRRVLGLPASVDTASSI